jgi:hypothetical protein
VPRSKAPNKSVGKCGKAIGKTGSRLRRCGKKAVAKVHSIKRRRWVPICGQARGGVAAHGSWLGGLPEIQPDRTASLRFVSAAKIAPTSRQALFHFGCSWRSGGMLLMISSFFTLPLFARMDASLYANLCFLRSAFISGAES